jgi:plastocyanin
MNEVQAKTHKVTVWAMDYIPAELNVSVGDRVVWINKDIRVHSVTALDNSFNSKSLRALKKWTLKITPQMIGEHDYKCIFHTGMKGKLSVK